MASGHIVASFDEDLGELNTMLTRLGGLAEKQFADAMDSLERRDIQNIDEIIARDAELDELTNDQLRFYLNHCVPWEPRGSHDSVKSLRENRTN